MVYSVVDIFPLLRLLILLQYLYIFLLSSNKAHTIGYLTLINIFVCIILWCEEHILAGKSN